MDFGKIVKDLGRTASKHSPEILTALGITGFITAVIMAVKATPKAEALIVEAEDEKEEDLTPVETVKAAWKPYLPAAITIVASTGCIIGGVKIQKDRCAELATAYAISQAVVKRYQEKTEEIAGEEKAREIETAVRQETAKSPEAQQAIANLPKSTIQGLHPFWDPMSNTGFNATVAMLNAAEVKLSKRLYMGLESYVTVNDLYDELNEQGVYPPMKHTSVGNMLGWTPEHSIKFDMDCDGIPIEQSHWDDGTPCYVMSFEFGKSPITIR